MKPTILPLPEGYAALVKEFEGVDNEIHVARKLGANVDITWWMMQLAKSKLPYAKASGSVNDLTKAKEMLIEVRRELEAAQQQLAHRQSDHVQVQGAVVQELALEGLQLLKQQKKMHAMFLYHQVTEKYKKLPQAAKQVALEACVQLKRAIAQQDSEDKVAEANKPVSVDHQESVQEKKV